MTLPRYAHDSITPYDEQLSKKEQVKNMFDKVANNYDFLNRFLSFRTDVYWRKCVINELKKTNAKTVLDVATGTGDLAIMAAKKIPKIKLTGIDISKNMIAISNHKINKLGFSMQITNQIGDAENLPYIDDSFEAVMVSFGIRNFENLNAGLKEIYRVLNKNGTLIILEFSQPKNYFIAWCYKLYSNLFINNIGKVFSKDKKAYTYLNKSSAKFLQAPLVKEILIQTGFTAVFIKSLTFGICTLYVAKK